MAAKSCVALLLPLVLLLLAGSSLAVAQLEVDYYSQTCPDVEALVREEMEQIISAAPSLAGPLLRLHFHDCFVRVSPVFNFCYTTNIFLLFPYKTSLDVCIHFLCTDIPID
jgi:hypothetical protein